MQKTAGLMGQQFGAPAGMRQRSQTLPQKGNEGFLAHGQSQADPSGDELPYNMSQTTARYLHDMKIEKEEIQARLDQSRNILEIELRKFKRHMAQQFQELAKRFAEYQVRQAQREQELWDAFR